MREDPDNPYSFAAELYSIQILKMREDPEGKIQKKKGSHASTFLMLVARGRLTFMIIFIFYY